MSVEPDKDGRGKLLTKTRTRSDSRLKRPKMYKVLFHNDDYTPRGFVVMLLQSLFQKSEPAATALMLHIHHNGLGVAGVFTFEIAETKVAQSMALAQEAQFPLLVTMEPEEVVVDD